MPFSILIHGYPHHDAPVPHVQGPALQGMFLQLLREVNPAVCERLHDDSRYRPYTLSPLGLGEPAADFQGFRLPRQSDIREGEIDLVCRLSYKKFQRDVPAFRLLLNGLRPEDVLELGEYLLDCDAYDEIVTWIQQRKQGNLS